MAHILANEITPFSPTHPGEILKDELEFRGISQKELAENINISYSYINEVLNCKRPLNTELAMMIEAALDISAEPLLNMQMRYNMQIAQKDSSFTEKLNKIRKMVAVL